MNIVFKKIIANFFLSLGENTEVDLDEQGFVLVKGVNLESEKSMSNGAGKSSIFDAILWTITGETMRGTSDVVNEKSESGCFCELHFSANNDEYVIKRYKSHPEFGNSVHFYENDVLLSDQTKKSQEMIGKAIPVMSSEILGSIVLLGQGLPYKFSSLSPTRRKDLLETMSGSSSQLDKLKYQLDCKESSLISERDNVSKDISGLNSTISSNSRLIEYMKREGQKKSPKEIGDEISLLSKKLGELFDESGGLEVKRDSEFSKLESLKRVYENLRDFIARTDSEIRTLNSSLSQVSEGVCPVCGRLYEDYEERSRLKNEYSSKIQEKSGLLLGLKAKLEGVQSQVSSQSSRCNEISSRISSLSYEIAKIKDQISGLQKSLSDSKDTESEIMKLEDENKRLSVEIYDKNKAVESLDDKITTVQFMKRTSSRDFKSYVLSEVVKFMSSRASSYGDYLFDLYKIKVSISGTKVLITIGDRPYENLSGGERQRVDLCVQFALRDMLMVTTGFSCNLLVLDEAFDNLDMQGSENLINLVTSEFSDVNSVFTVTHHSDISIPYDKTLTVVKCMDGVSKVGEEI